MTSVPSLDSAKENLYSFIVKNERVDISRLVKWAEEHGIGKVGLSILLRILEKEKKIIASDLRENIAIIKIKDGEFRIELPRYVEAAHAHHRHVVSTTKKKVASIESILGLEPRKTQTKKQKSVTEQKTTQAITQATIQQVEAKPETIQSPIQTSLPQVQKSETETKPESVQVASSTVQIVAKDVEKQTAVKEISEKVTTAQSMEFNSIIEEVLEEIKGYPVDREKVEQIVTSVLAYLSRYWSVGELRLRLDLSKTLSQKLRMEQDVLFELIGRVLKVLKRFDIVEIVEPGIVNLLRRDVCKEFSIKLSEVLGF